MTGRLEKLAARNPEKIDESFYDSGQGCYWIYLKPGWSRDGDGTHNVNGKSIRDVQEKFRSRVRECRADCECKTNGVISGKIVSQFARIDYEAKNGASVGISCPLSEVSGRLEKIFAPARVEYRGAHVGGIDDQGLGNCGDDQRRRWFRWSWIADIKADMEIDRGFVCDCTECELRANEETDE